MRNKTLKIKFVSLTASSITRYNLRGTKCLKNQPCDVIQMWEMKDKWKENP